nr:MAG TPA: hypothetical protein [Caudoviricetes sp.]
MFHERKSVLQYAGFFYFGRVYQTPDRFIFLLGVFNPLS